MLILPLFLIIFSYILFVHHSVLFTLVSSLCSLFFTLALHYLFSVFFPIFVCLPWFLGTFQIFLYTARTRVSIHWPIRMHIKLCASLFMHLCTIVPAAYCISICIFGVFRLKTHSHRNSRISSGNNVESTVLYYLLHSSLCSLTLKVQWNK